VGSADDQGLRREQATETESNLTRKVEPAEHLEGPTDDADGAEQSLPRVGSPQDPRRPGPDAAAGDRKLRPRISSSRPRSHQLRARLPAEMHTRDHHHRAVGTGGARAAVFGISDGLVTNVALILGIAGAHPSASFVRLAGVAGLVAGALSMSAGEYVSMRAQNELFQRELALEHHEIEHRPEGERRELVRIYEGRGIEPDVAHQLASEMMRTPELALETHAREELGINPSFLGSPIQAALSSFVTFAFGALLPLLPWLFTGGESATLGSVVIGGLAAFGIGIALSFFTKRSWWRTGLRQLSISAVAAGATYGIGHAIGVSGIH
jgi:vacuolar iron transporter family protein